MRLWLQWNRKRIMIGGALVLLILAFVGYRGRDGGESGTSEWRTVNNAMGELLASPVLEAKKPSAAISTPAPSQEAADSSPDAKGPVPTPGSVSPSPVPSKPPATNRIDLNTSSVARLMDLPGIGESKAKAIVAYRESHGPFKATEDLMKVKGIGPKTYESLKERVTVLPQQ